MAIVIEKGVEIPTRGRRNGKYAEIRAVLKEMEAGDSFVVPNDTGTKLSSQRTMVGKVAEQVGVRVTTHVEDGHLRVWRLSETDTETGGVS